MTCPDEYDEDVVVDGAEHVDGVLLAVRLAAWVAFAAAAVIEVTS